MNKNLKPLSVIYNQKSGFHSQDQNSVYEQIISIFIQNNFDVESFELNDDTNFDELLSKILDRHQNSEHKGVIVAAGGDGTLNAVAQKLMYGDIPMGILPLGTFNYVARVLEIPLDLVEAAKVIATGQTRASHVGNINQHIYLNNASLGLYPLFIKKREQFNQRFGRLLINAYTSGLDVLIRENKQLKLEVEVDGQVYPVKTPLIFLGNNQLQLEELKLKIAADAAQGHVAGVVIAKGDKLSLFKMLFQLIRGKLEKTPDVYSFSADQVKISSKKKQLTVAIDGEIFEIDTPLNISVAKSALKIMVPHATTSV